MNFYFNLFKLFLFLRESLLSHYSIRLDLSTLPHFDSIDFSSQQLEHFRQSLYLLNSQSYWKRVQSSKLKFRHQSCFWDPLELNRKWSSFRLMNCCSTSMIVMNLIVPFKYRIRFPFPRNYQWFDSNCFSLLKNNWSMIGHHLLSLFDLWLQ